MTLSEVARVRAQIWQECEAMELVFHGFAACASHESIAARYWRLDGCINRLTTLVGEEKAMAEVYGTYDTLMDAEPEEALHMLEQARKDGLLEEQDKSEME